MTLTAHTLRTRIVTALHQALASEHFIADHRKAVLSRKLSFGADVIWVHVAKRGSGNRILATWVYLGIHVDVVEGALAAHQLRSVDSLSPMLTTTLHLLEPSVIPKVWLVDTTDEQDMEQQIAALIERVLTRGLSFLGQFQSLESLLQTLLDKSPQSLAMAGGYAAWCVKVVVLWSLLGKSEDTRATARLVFDCREGFAGHETELATFEAILVQLSIPASIGHGSLP